MKKIAKKTVGHAPGSVRKQKIEGRPLKIVIDEELRIWIWYQISSAPAGTKPEPWTMVVARDNGEVGPEFTYIDSDYVFGGKDNKPDGYHLFSQKP